MTIPGLEVEEASVPTTNTQFDYETVDRLQETLELQYGQVSRSRTDRDTCNSEQG